MTIASEPVRWVIRSALTGGREAVPAAEAWASGLADLSANRLSSYAAWLLGPDLRTMSATVLEALQRAAGHAALATERTGTQMGELAGALSGAGYPWLILKGPPLAERLYPDPLCRPARDLDLLVPPDALDSAAGLLHGLGYRTGTEMDLELYHVRYERPVVPGWSDLVELHWRADPPGRGQVPPEHVLRTRVARTTRWGDVWVPSPEVERDLLVRHYVRHAGWQAVLLLDVLLHLHGQPYRHPLGELLEDDQRRLGITPLVTGPHRWRHRPLRRWMAAHTFAERREARRTAPMETALAAGATGSTWLGTISGLLWPRQPSPRWHSMAASRGGRHTWRIYRLLTLGHGAPKESPSPPQWRRGLGVRWSLAIWLGLATGLAEVTVHLLRRHFRHRMVLLGDDMVWMAPLAEVGLFLLVGGIVWGIQALRGQPRHPGLISCFLFLGAAEVLLSYPGLHWAASLLLAAGIAVQGSRLVHRHAALADAVVRRTLPVLIAVVLLSAAALQLGRPWLERRAIARLPAASGQNVLLIILDTVRGLDLEGGFALDTYMPRLGAWARSGVRFDRAIAPSSWTLPSHASFFTGLWPQEHGATWGRPLDGRFLTLAEEFSRSGYLTAGFAANKVYTTRQSGLARGFQHYEDFTVGAGELLRSSTLLRFCAENPGVRRFLPWRDAAGRKNADRMDHDLLSWLGSGKPRPFFAFVNFFDAHAPWEPPPPYDQALKQLPGANGRDPRRRSFDVEKYEVPAAPVLAEIKAAYLGSLRYLDDRVGALLDSLRQRGFLRNTIVIVSSDHGEEFGEHGIMSHGTGLYRSSVQVPLLILMPGDTVPERQVAVPVSLRDLPMTILALLGRSDRPFPGESFAGLVRGDSGVRIHQPVASVLLEAHRRPPWPDLISIIADTMHLIRSNLAEPLLFHFERDPLELHEVGTGPGGGAAADRLGRIADSVLDITRP